MFCTQCGKPNDVDASFCEFCGAKLIRPQDRSGQMHRDNSAVNNPGRVHIQPGAARYENHPDSSAAGNRRVSQASARLVQSHDQGIRTAQYQQVKVSKGLVFVIAEAFVLLIALYFLFNAYSISNSPEKTAERFFVALVNGNYEKAFKCFEIEEEPLVNASELENAMYTLDLSHVQNYTVRSHSNPFNEYGEDSELGKTLEIVYRNEGDESDSSMSISVMRSGPKGKWYVSSNQFFSRDVSIVVPRGAQVEIDEIPLTENDAADKVDEYSGAELTEYKISKMFSGEHRVTVSSEDVETAYRIWNVYGDEDVFEITDFVYTQETIYELQDLAVQNMESIYQSVLSGSGFDSISDLFTSNPEYLENIREEYQYLEEYMNGEDRKVLQMSFSGVTANANTTWPETSVSFSCEASFNYESWDGAVKNEISEDTYDLDFSFVKENGTWVQTNLGCRNLYL